MKRKQGCKWLVIIVIAILTLGIGNAIAQEKIVKVGVSAPLTGPYALWGRDTKAGVEMAFEAINYKIGNYKFEIVWIDDQSDPGKATNAFAEAVERKGINVAFYDVNSSVSVALMDLVAKYKIPFFFPLGAADTINTKWLTDPKKYSYFGGKGWAVPQKLSVGYVDSIDNAVAKGLWKPATKKVGIYGEDTDWGRSLGGEMAKLFKKSGWEVVSQDWFPQTQVDFYPLLTRYKEGKVSVMAGTSGAIAPLAALIYDAVADFINSIAAVKYLVFEKKQLTMAELLDALDNNFKGYEAIQKLCQKAPKFGNDIPEVDKIGSEMFGFIATETESYHGKYGRMTAGMLPVTAHVPLGFAVGALPSGRNAWTTLTDGISPTGGTDISGATAVLKSIAKIPHDLYVSGTLLNMKIEPALLETEIGMRNLMALLKSLCSLGIYHVQFNVISAETLLKAQEHPDDYRDLLIRVAGYTAYFVELGKDVQDEIIGRTVHHNLTGTVVQNLTMG